MDDDAGAGVVVSLASSSPSAISSSFALLALQHRGEREKRGGGGDGILRQLKVLLTRVSFTVWLFTRVNLRSVLHM